MSKITIFEDPSKLSKKEMKLMAMEAITEQASEVMTTLGDIILLTANGWTRTPQGYEDLYAMLQEVHLSLQDAQSKMMTAGRYTEGESAPEKWVIKQVLDALPKNRDWLDPDLEKMMKEIAK